MRGRPSGDAKTSGYWYRGDTSMRDIGGAEDRGNLKYFEEADGAWPAILQRFITLSQLLK
jgi:hypothetical protein